MAKPEAYTAVIPAFNAERFIDAALESVLAQSRRPAGIIVVDDGSVDQTAARAARHGPLVTVLRQENSGPAGAINAGLRVVDTPILAFLDADDQWLPGKAERQLRHLAEHAATDAVFGRCRNLRDDGQLPAVGEETTGWGRTTMMIRNESARRIGMMTDPAGGHGEMIDWLARGRELGLHFHMIDDLVAIRRVHPDSLTYKRSDRDRGYLVTVKAALDRRRANGP